MILFNFLSCFSMEHNGSSQQEQIVIQFKITKRFVKNANFH